MDRSSSGTSSTASGTVNPATAELTRPCAGNPLCMSAPTRARAALLDLLVWAALLEGVLWGLTWVDVHDAASGGTAVPGGLRALSFAGAAGLGCVALATAVTWWRDRLGGRAWFAVLALVVALTAHDWARVPSVGWLQWASYALAAGLVVAVLPGVWTSARHLGVGLIRPHDLTVVGQTGWELLLPAVASCVALLALATQLARGRPVSD